MAFAVIAALACARPVRADDYPSFAKTRMLTLLSDRRFHLSRVSQLPLCVGQKSCAPILSFVKNGDFNVIEPTLVLENSDALENAKRLEVRCPNFKVADKFGTGLQASKIYRPIPVSDEGGSIYIISNLSKTKKFESDLRIYNFDSSTCTVKSHYLTSRIGFQKDAYSSELVRHDGNYYMVTFSSFQDPGRTSILIVQYYG